MACWQLLGPEPLRNRCVNDAFDQQCRWQRRGGESLVEAASLVAQDPCAFPAVQSQQFGDFNLLWEVCSAASSALCGVEPARGFAYPCVEGMLDEAPTRGTHTLPRDKRADLTRAPIVVPSSPPAFGPGKPECISQGKWDKLSRGSAESTRLWKAWVAANFEGCFRCRFGLLNASTSQANNLGFSKLHHNLSFGGPGQCTFDPDWSFNLFTGFVLPTALLPAEIVTEIGDTIARGYNDAGRYEEDDGNDDVLEHVRTLGLHIQLNLMMQRYQCEFVVAPQESNASIRTRLEREPSAWFVSTFTVEVQPVLTYPSWHSWNPKSNMLDPSTGEPWYLGSGFLTYGAESTSIFRATRRHDKTDAMASCMLNAAFPERLMRRVSLVLCPKFSNTGEVQVHVALKVS